MCCKWEMPERAFSDFCEVIKTLKEVSEVLESHWNENIPHEILVMWREVRVEGYNKDIYKEIYGR